MADTMVNGSNIFDDTDSFLTYRYRISEFYIIYEDETDELPTERITDFKIDHYFEEAMFPVFKLNVMMEPSRYYKIIKNKLTVRFHLRLQKYYVKNSDEKDQSLFTDVINDTFMIFPDDTNEYYDKDFQLESDTLKTDKKESDINKLEKINNLIELFLFKPQVHQLTKMHNYILGNCDLCTAVTYLLTKGYVDNVLISPFENQTSYSQLILPPLSINKLLRYLDNNYGFYKKGSLIYFGLQHGYILNYHKPDCTAYEKKEWKETIIYVLQKNTKKAGITGELRKKDIEVNHFIVSSSVVTAEDILVSGNQTGGINPTLVNPYNQAWGTGTPVPENNQSVGYQNNFLFFQKTPNNYLLETLTAEQAANSMRITIYFENIPMEAFNPNKKFSIFFENTLFNNKFKGTYKISSAVYTFSNTGADYSINAMIVFKKIG